MRRFMIVLLVMLLPAWAYALKVDYIHCGVGVKNRKIVGQSEDFKVGERVYCLSSISGIKKPTYVIHRWVSDGGSYDIKLAIKPFKRFRTWSYRTLRSPGVWKLEVLDSNGKLLREKIFVVK